MHAEAEPLRRQLSALGLWLLITNGMIGAGIFGVPGELARLAGSSSPWIFVICAALIFPVMLCFAELASHFRASGGPVAYATAAFGPAAGFQAGWALYVARLTAFSANANLLVSTVAGAWPAAPQGPLRLALLFAVCAFLAVLNVVSARGAIRWLGGLTVLKFAPLVLLIVAGLARSPPSALRVPASSAPDLAAAILLAIYAFVGFESAPVAAGESREPQRDLPRALLAALVVCALLYALVQYVAVGAQPGLGASLRPLVDAAVALAGPAGLWMMTAGIVASVGANLTGTMYTIPRVTYRLALDGSLPRWFGAVHDAWRTPAASIVFFAVAGFLVAASGTFAALAGLSVVVRLLLYLICIAAMPGVRRRFGDVPGHWRLPGGWLIPGLALVECVALLAQVPARYDAWAAGFLCIGAVLYAAARRRG